MSYSYLEYMYQELGTYSTYNTRDNTFLC